MKRRARFRFSRVDMHSLAANGFFFPLCSKIEESPENRKKTAENKKKTAFIFHKMGRKTQAGTEQTGIKRGFLFFFVQKLYNKCMIRVSGLRSHGLAYRYIPVVSQPGPTVRPLLSAVSIPAQAARNQAEIRPAPGMSGLPKAENRIPIKKWR